jgi:hypothetical protein
VDLGTGRDGRPDCGKSPARPEADQRAAIFAERLKGISAVSSGARPNHILSYSYGAKSYSGYDCRKGKHSVYTRRFFVKSGLALSAIALGAGTELEAHRTPLALRTPDRLPLHLAIIDVRFARGRAFATAMRERSVPVADYLGDVTSVWYERLDPVWRRAPITVGGLTTAGTLFCLERLAWDHSMRVIYRGIHSLLPDGGTQHLLESSSRTAALVLDPQGNLRLWSVQLANLMAEMSSSLPALPSQTDDRCRVTYRTDRAECENDAGLHLTSWLIVPHACRQEICREPKT